LREAGKGAVVKVEDGVFFPLPTMLVDSLIGDPFIVALSIQPSATSDAFLPPQLKIVADR
jgi:hypothetical protein